MIVYERYWAETKDSWVMSRFYQDFFIQLVMNPKLLAEAERKLPLCWILGITLLHSHFSNWGFQIACLITPPSKKTAAVSLNTLQTRNRCNITTSKTQKSFESENGETLKKSIGRTYFPAGFRISESNNVRTFQNQYITEIDMHRCRALYQQFPQLSSSSFKEEFQIIFLLNPFPFTKARESPFHVKKFWI